MFDEWKIFNKTVTIVTDGGNNIIVAVKVLGIENRPRVAYKLNLIIKNSLKNYEDNYDNAQSIAKELKYILKAAKSIITYFKHNEAGK